jgi:predicted nucleic acid-binding protein
VSCARVLLDTNVILDLMLARAPFDRPAIELAAAAVRGDIVAYVCATSVTTIHYIARKQLGRDGAARAVGTLLEAFRVAAVTDVVLQHALARDFSDFEDAVIDAAAEHVGATAIVTRDAKGFATSALAVFSPSEMVHALSAK